jgi:lysophospholipase L1-like esterase
VPSDVSAAAPAYATPLRFVALGDGYTEGAVVSKRDSWPAQLQQVMSGSDTRLRLISVLAEGSQASGDVLRDQLPQVGQLQPDVVTLQVGANDIILGGDVDAYRQNLSAIFEGLLEIVPATRIFAITTPDHKITPRGRGYSGEGEVATFNAALQAEADERGIVVVNISPVYDHSAVDPSLIVGDGPDPSARQFAGWVELIGQQMRQSLTASSP